MRTAEWIQAGFALILAATAWFRPLPLKRQWIAALLAAFALGAIAAAHYSDHFLAPLQVSILRDWLPVVLMLVPYWQAGQFFLWPNEQIQNWLISTDRALLKDIAPATKAISHSTRLSMEYAYLSCYPMVPLGLATLYAAGRRAETDAFWFMVLVPTYVCYGITPFVPALPPRSLPGKQLTYTAPNFGRVLNHFVLRHGSIHAISFPSAHVASSLAVALVLLRFVPAAGVIFLAVSIWIAVAAVVGGYHYALDVLLGAALSLVVFVAWVSHLVSFIAAAFRIL